MYEVEVTSLAHDDLAEIVNYISQELANPSAAAELLDKVEAQYEYLKSTPKMFALCTDGRLQEKGYRKICIGNYLMIFKIDEELRIVYILRVVYFRRDYSQLV